MMGAITRIFLPKALWITALATLLTISGCSGGGSDAPPPSSAPSYSISVSAAPTAGGIVTGDGVYSDGSRVSVTASPSTGYHLVNWTEGGAEVSTLPSYTFSATADRTLVANFGINSYTVSTHAGPNGTIAQTSATVDHGDTTSFTVTPANGYSIASVSGCSGSLNGTTTTYTTGQITADCTVSATFIAGGGTSTFFTIGTSVMPTAGGVVSGGGSYSSASSVTLTAAPNTGYHFVNWTEGGTVISTATSLTFTASADRNLVANFSINRYTVGTSAGPNGTISPTSTTVNHGGTTSFTITPANGYSIGSVNGCNGVLNVTSATYTTGQITADCTVTAGFVAGSAKPLHTIGVNAVPSGSGGVSGGGTYSDGSSVTVTATANTGYHFVNWTEGGAEVSTLPSYTFSAAADRTLVANFALNTYTIGATAAPTAGGVVSGGSTYNHGDAVTLTATANTGYHFLNWTEGGTVVSTAPSLTFTVTADRTLVANFALNTYTIGATVIPVAGGAVAGGGTYNHGDAVTLTATANTGYHFVNWTEGGTEVSTATSLSFTANADRTLSANFAPNTYTINVGTAPAAGGSSSGGGAYSYNSSVTVTATANTGYQFVNWTEGGTVVSTAPSLTFTVAADRTLVANFALISTVTYTGSTPVDGATGVSPIADITVTASAALDPASIDTTSVSLTAELGGSPVVSSALSYIAATNTITINPDISLPHGVKFRLTLSGVKDTLGSIVTTKTILFTVSVNPALKDISYDATGAVAEYSANTLDATGVIMKTVRYTATGADMMPATVDDGVGPDGLWFTADDIPISYQAYSYDAAGNQTRSVTYMADGIGLDGIWFTADDVPDSYTSNSFDAVGNKTQISEYTAAGADLVLGTADDGFGPDGLWFTADDVPMFYETNTYDSAGKLTRTVAYAFPGADGVWFNADDVLDAYFAYSHTTGKMTETKYFAAGADGVPGTPDDGMGPDGVWFTADDVTGAYTDFSSDAVGKPTQISNYTALGADGTPGTPDDGMGPDGLWFTADDVPISYDTFSYDAAGNQTRSKSYMANGIGLDGIWFTADDVPDGYTRFSFDAAGNRTQSLSYTSAGVDGVWFTPDDVRTFETLFNTTI